MISRRIRIISRNSSQRLLTLAGILILFGCGESSIEQTDDLRPAVSDGKLLVCTVNYPLQYFAQRIGGESVRVEFPAPANTDPVSWEPELSQILLYQRADLILVNGGGYAKWVDLTTLPTTRFVDVASRRGVDLISHEGAEVHTHGPQGEHSHGELSYALWLDPMAAIAQAEVIREALTNARPNEESVFGAGFDSLRTDLVALDQRFKVVLDAYQGKPLLSAHADYSYLARRFGLVFRSVSLRPDRDVELRDWRDLLILRRDFPAETLFWGSNPLDETREKLLEIGITSLVFDTASARPESGDYLSIMMDNVDRIAANSPER